LRMYDSENTVCSNEKNENQTEEVKEIINKKIGEQKYELIDKKNLKTFLAELSIQKEFCFDTESTGLDPFSSKLLGISFCWKVGTAYYLPIDLIEVNAKKIKAIFADESIKKIGHNLKYDMEVLNQFCSSSSQGEVPEGRRGLPTARQTTPNPSLERRGTAGLYFDTMIASYILNPGVRQHGLDTLAFVEFGYQMQPIEALIGKGKDQVSLAEIPLEKVSWYSCEDADFTFRLYDKFKKELADSGMAGLFHDLEMPLTTVLADIETNGVKINDKALKKLSVEFDGRIKIIEKKVWKMAGEEFNLASPKQLKEILFEKMKISSVGIGKTKTGLSTAAAELEKMKGEHEIIDLLIEFRELSKLKSTYLDALPLLINKKDGRVHTSFNQTVTATGRLSSSEPNLQNIPIRTETGGQIRKAFIAEKGFQIMKADYSQIELRIVASLADDQQMLKIFNDGGDIHTMTAALIHGIPASEVTKEIRRTAKEVNFGVLYGMGAWGLSSRTGISNAEAQEFIFKYFSAFSGVKKWLEETIVMARDKGYVETLLGRRRYLPEINSSMGQVRSSAERMAVNHPIQGSAADMIKLAMIEINNGLPKVSPESRMILQVHDELVFELPETEIKKVAKFINDTMCSVMKLRAPIEVEVSVGDNWGETEKIKL
ncbi:MAG: DNA polymerase I, partial [bacterium]